MNAKDLSLTFDCNGNVSLLLGLSSLFLAARTAPLSMPRLIILLSSRYCMIYDDKGK